MTAKRTITLTPSHLAIGVAAALVGFLAGAPADDDAVEGKEAAAIAAKEPLPIMVQPPAFAMDDDGFALVAAQNGQYYIVCTDGTSREVLYPNGRQFMYWR